MTEENQTDSTETVSPEENVAPRRKFFSQLLAGMISAIVGLVPMITGTLFFLDPLFRKKTSEKDGELTGGVIKDDDGYIKMSVTADALPADGTPQLFKVKDDVVDAWNKFLNVDVGSVWLRRMPNHQVIAFSSICPHLGCTVDYRKSNNDFYCPCHTSAFDVDGKKKNVMPPRGMDTLQLKQNGNELWIKYEKFRAETSEKIVIS